LPLFCEKRNGVFRQRTFRIDGDQRQMGILGGNLFCQCCQVPFNRTRCSGDNRGRLQLLDRAAGVGPAGLDHRKHPGLIERGRKCRPPGIRYHEDRALLGHLRNSDRTRKSKST